MRRRVQVLSGIAGALLAAATPAAAATRVVDDNGTPCPGATFTTIQSAVDAAAAGDTVLVCDGRYREQVTIGEGKSNLRLIAKVVRGAIIQAPSSMEDPGAIVRVTDGVTGVQIRRFIIEGPGDDGRLQYGVLVDENSVASQVRDNRIRVIRNFIFPPGTGIGVGDPDTGTTGRVTDLSNNTIERYIVDGVRVTNPGSYAQLSFNNFNAFGEQNPFRIDGIQVDDGARARLIENRLVGHRRGGDDSSPFPDVLTQSAPSDAAAAIRLMAPATSGMFIYNNKPVDNDTGIRLINTDGAVLRSNRPQNNEDGIVVDSASTGNRFESNDARTNTNTDCVDESVGDGTGGTANTWLFNRGLVDVPATICAP